jgi:putative hemolysin
MTPQAELHVSSADSPAPRARPIDTAGVLPAGILRQAYRWVQPAVEAWFELPALWSLYDATARNGTGGPSLAVAMFDRLGVTWSVDATALADLRKIEGPLVVVCNHPFGGLDALALMQLLDAIRPAGWRMFANEVMCAVPEFGPRLIAVDPLGRSEHSLGVNRRGLLLALRHLQSGGVLGVFPAARVSHWSHALGAVCDRPWSDHALRLAAKTGATVACLHIPGANSRRFLAVPPAWSRLRALTLGRELVRPAVRHVTIRLAAMLGPADVRRLGRGQTAGERLRARCFLRADQDLPRPSPAESARRAVSAAIAVPGDERELRAEVARLTQTCRLFTSPDGELDVLLVRGSDAPGLLQDLGRCRELTFRAAGQGVGRARDLAPEDEYYHHLVVWHRARGGIVGAYRLGLTREIVASRGPQGLYLAHVFRLRPEFLERLGPAIELSRSFVMPEFQRDNRALALLWRGLGAAALKHGCGTFFGSVTISNQHHPASRAILVEHLQRNHADAPAMRRLVRARRPFQPATRYHPLVGAAYAGEPIDALAPLVDHLEAGQRGIPPLLRYYCSLGARFLACHVEADFQDALYCLLRVDLATIPPAYRRRFLGT